MACDVVELGYVVYQVLDFYDILIVACKVNGIEGFIGLLFDVDLTLTEDWAYIKIN
jgi:hypothetical protein